MSTKQPIKRVVVYVPENLHKSLATGLKEHGMTVTGWFNDLAEAFVGAEDNDQSRKLGKVQVSLEEAQDNLGWAIEQLNKAKGH